MQLGSRRMLGRRLAFLALLLFALVLYLPAFTGADGGEADIIRGWYAAVLSLVLGWGALFHASIKGSMPWLGLLALSNLLFVLVPLALWRNWRVRIRCWMLGITLVCLPQAALSFLTLLGDNGHLVMHVDAGYMLWVADYALLAIALLIYGAGED